MQTLHQKAPAPPPLQWIHGLSRSLDDAMSAAFGAATSTAEAEEVKGVALKIDAVGDDAAAIRCKSRRAAEWGSGPGVSTA